MSLILLATPPAGDTEGLTGISPAQDVDPSSERGRVKRSQIRPKRRIRQASFCNRLLQNFEAEGFPLHVSEDAQVSESEFKAEFKPAAAGAEGQDCEFVVNGSTPFHHRDTETQRTALSSSTALPCASVPLWLALRP